MSILDHQPNVIVSDSIVDSYDKSKLPALSFTRGILSIKPELFGNNIQGLLYALFGGLEYTSDNVFQSLKTYVQHTNDKVLLHKRTYGTIPVEADTSFIIQWARALKDSKELINYEPIMEHINLALKVFHVNSTVYVNGEQMGIATIKPLCYTMNGDYIYDLLPYIAYIMTFLLNGSPFKFMSTFYEAAGFTFLALFNDHLQKGYANLAKDLDINIGSNGLSALSNIDDKYFIDLFNVILSPEAIIDVRNKYMSQTKGLLDSCIREQYVYTKEFIQTKYTENISHLCELIIAINPIKHVYDQLPTWNSDMTINAHELSQWTEYTLAGGDKDIAILPVNGRYINKCANDEGVFFEGVTNKNALTTQVKAISTTHQPFSSNDIVLKMASAAVANEYANTQQDVFADGGFTLDDTITRDNFTSISSSLKDIWINAKWLVQKTSMHNILFELPVRAHDELKNLLKASELCEHFYGDHLKSAVMSALIVGLLDELIQSSCDNNLPLNTFSFIDHIARFSYKVYAGEINKLMDMCVAFTMLFTDAYVSFVNSIVSEFMSELIVTKYVFMPYVKGLDDLADVYAIGGIDLYDYAKSSNPLVRAYAWYADVVGVNEQVYTFNAFASRLVNGALLELLESFEQNKDELKQALQYNFTQQWTKGKDTPSELPRLLSNYTFTSGGYERKSTAYVNELNTLDTLVKYIFKRSSAAQSIEQHIYFKQLLCDNKIDVKSSTVDKFIVDDVSIPVKVDAIAPVIQLPVYDLNGSIENIGVSLIRPGGYNIKYLYLTGNMSYKNNTIMIINDIKPKTRYQKYEFDGSAKPRLTRLTNAALIKQQASNLDGTISSALKLANAGVL